MNESNSALRWAKLYDAAEESALGSQVEAGHLEQTGPALLTFGSALGGAVLGWMLTQWLTSYSRRNSAAEGEP